MEDRLTDRPTDRQTDLGIKDPSRSLEIYPVIGNYILTLRWVYKFICRWGELGHTAIIPVQLVTGRSAG